MTPISAPHTSGLARLRRASGPGLATVAVLGTYGVVVAAGAGGSFAHVIARAARDWPLLLLAVGTVAPNAFAEPATTIRGALATGVALTSALVTGDHTLAELEDTVGVRLLTAPSLPVPYAALAAVGLLVAACISVHGLTPPWRPKRSGVAT
jgi:hypothetical protein